MDTSLVAPGTETDELKPVNLYESVKLDDGTWNFIFTRICENPELWRCNICDCTINGSVEKHATGKKHQQSMTNKVHQRENWHKLPSTHVKRITVDFKLAPGEPVPPGFEDEVRGVTEIQASLDAYHSGPLIGLEYLVELSMFEDDREPGYVCLLCDKRGDPRTVMAHLVSFNHRMTYLQAHFPTVYRMLNPYNTRQYRRNVQNTVTNICEHIEKKYGRMTPQVADREAFERKKQEYIDNLSKDTTHPSERFGETFEHLVDKNVILSGPKDILAEINKANEEQQVKNRQYRKSGTLTGRDPSPPVVQAPGKRVMRKSQPNKERERSLSSISSISSSSLSSPRSRSRSRSKSNTKFQKRQQRPYNKFNQFKSRSRSRSPYQRQYRRSRSYSRSPPRYKTFGGQQFFNNSKVPPWQRPDYGTRKEMYNDRKMEESRRRAEMIKNDRYDEFRRLCSEVEDEMAKVLEQHEKNPEKHSAYPEEWKKFWHRRYKELQAENKDPSKHDFKPEWIDFWNKRMREMHNAELKAKKDSIRKRLNLPEEPAPISFKIMGKKKPGSNASVEKEILPLKKKSLSPDPEVIIIDDSKDDDIIIKDRKRSHSPWESEPERSRDYKERKYERERDTRERIPRERPRERDRPSIVDYPSRDYYKSRSFVREPVFKRIPLSPKYMERESSPPEDTSTDINIVAILRLLTALEDKLGSLGPRCIEMLSQALAMEKAEANSSETLLDNDVNCVFFETVKEKLKGILLAGLVELRAEKSFKNCIQKIASLLHTASERKRETEKKMKEKTQEPVKIPGIGTVDKAAIARQIATALIAQGKTDVTQAELEQLINAVVGMAQASQNSGKPISTASFIQQLSNPLKQESSTSQSSTKSSTMDFMSSALEMLQKRTSSPSPKPQSSMEGLSDSDLKTLLQNFKDLSTDEQHGLITYLKKLEAKEPERVERLRKFVKLGSGNSDAEKAYTSGRLSPFSNREVGANPSLDDIDKKSVNKTPVAPPKKLIDSDEDDDYSFEDVFRAASKNVSDKQKEDEMAKIVVEQTPVFDKTKDLGVNLTDAKMIIANLMGQLGATNKNSSPALNLLGLSTTPTTATMTPTISVSSNLLNLPGSETIKPITLTTTNASVTSVDPPNVAYPQNNMNYNQSSSSDPNYGYNNREYSGYDDYNQYQNHQNFNNPEFNQGNVMDYSGVPGSNVEYGMQEDYHNMYPNQGMQPRPPFNSRGNFPYDPRQNYY